MRLLLVFIGLITTAISFGQNLIPNGDFETNSFLPDGTSDWSACVGWNKIQGGSNWYPNASPDYFHTAGTGSGNAPNTYWADCLPHQGNAMVGLYVKHGNGSNFREYLSRSLPALTIGQTYQISFWMCSGQANAKHGASTSNVGVQFTTSPFTQATSEPLGGTPQFEVLSDNWLANWTYYSGTFTATSAFTYVTIGVFPSNAGLTSWSVQYPGNNWPGAAYYYIDDLVLEEITPLPIELLTFEAEKNDSGVELTWETATELDNDYFIVERSMDLDTWELIGQVDGAGSSSSNSDYKLLDPRPNEGFNYYRLKQVDFNGNETISGIRPVEVRSSGLADLEVYPNPVNDRLTIKNVQGHVSIFDLTGHLVFEQKTADSLLVVDVQDFQNGIYIVRSGDRVMRVQKY